MSVAFTKEDSAETASETQLPARPISSAVNLVTPQGREALEAQLAEARAAYEVAQLLDDVNERRRQGAAPLRDLRYFAERLRTAQVVPPAEADGTIAFGSTVTLQREGRPQQTYRIVGEDEADPKGGTLSHVSPLALELLGKEVGDVVTIAGQEAEILAVR